MSETENGVNNPPDTSTDLAPRVSVVVIPKLSADSMASEEEEGEAAGPRSTRFRRLPTEKEIAELREMFDLIDTDGSGDISKDELADLMRTLGFNPSEAELDEMMEEVDEDDTQSIYVDEFIKVLTRQNVEVHHSPQEIKKAFESFVQHDDYVEPNTVKSALIAEALATFKSEFGRPERPSNVDSLIRASSLAIKTQDADGSTTGDS